MLQRPAVSAQGGTARCFKIARARRSWNLWLTESLILTQWWYILVYNDYNDYTIIIANFSWGWSQSMRKSKQSTIQYKGIPHRGLNTTLLSVGPIPWCFTVADTWRLDGSLLAQFLNHESTGRAILQYQLEWDFSSCHGCCWQHWLFGNTEDSETPNCSSRFFQLEWIATFGWPLEGKWQLLSWVESVPARDGSTIDSHKFCWSCGARMRFWCTDGYL